MAKKQVNYELLGEQCKTAREELFVTFAHSNGLPKDTIKHLQNAIEQLDKFRSKAEDRMLREYPEKTLDIFYGHRVKHDGKGGVNK